MATIDMHAVARSSIRFPVFAKPNGNASKARNDQRTALHVMTRPLDDFEEHRAQLIAAFIEMPMPSATWKTPDGKIWTPQQVLQGWAPRSSDHWAWRTLHAWIMKDDVAVRHVELPVAYQQPDDEAWQFVTKLGNGNFELEPHGAMGRGDMLVHYDSDELGLFVEFGTCTPAKFVFNLGATGNDWMLVPGGRCSYGFVFTPLRPPLLRGTLFVLAFKPLAPTQEPR